MRRWLPALLLAGCGADAVTEGYNRLAAEDWTAAVDRFSDSIREHPERVEAYVGRGMAWRRLDKLDNAYADFSTALKRDPGHATALQFRGEVRFYMGDTEGAIEDLEAASRHGAAPELLAELIFARGHGRMVEGDLAGAAADFERYAAMVPEGPRHDRALQLKARVESTTAAQ